MNCAQCEIKLCKQSCTIGLERAGRQSTQFTLMAVAGNCCTASVVWEWWDMYSSDPQACVKGLIRPASLSTRKGGMSSCRLLILLLLWGLLRSRKNRGISIPKYMLPTLVQLPLISSRKHVRSGPAKCPNSLPDSGPLYIRYLDSHSVFSPWEPYHRAPWLEVDDLPLSGRTRPNP